MNELVVRVSLPLCRFSPASYNYAWPGQTIFGWHSGGKMHECGDWREDSLGMINESYELAQICLSAQIKHAIKTWVKVTSLADLDKKKFFTKMIYYLLIALWLPPFDGDIELSSGANNPEWNILIRSFVYLAEPSSFLLGKMYIALKESG